MATQLTGAEILIRSLQEEGVEYVFGYPGGSVLNIYDALCAQKKIHHVLARHEQGAAHAADGYSRSSGKVGVCLMTSGPGATNAVTGIATAYMDSSPIVAITGQVSTPFIGQDAFQECDTVGITRPCVKHNFLVKDVTKLAQTVKEAFYIARTGRPGPVLIDLPKDVTQAMAEFNYPKTLNMRSYNPVIKAHLGQIKKAVALLQKAERPLIYIGGGVILSNAAQELTKLAHELGYPVTETLMGLGGFPGSDKQSLGMLGMHGTYEANLAMQNCDVLLAIGARFDDRVIGNVPSFVGPFDRKIIHVDIDPSSIAKRVQVDVPIVGDVGDVVREMLNILSASPKGQNAKAIEAWWKQIEEWRKTNCLQYAKEVDKIEPQHVIQTIYRLTKDSDAIITTDVGQHQMWAAQYYLYDQPRKLITSGGLGTMGFGLPAAIGTQVANPGKPVICVTGEASIQMCIQELATAKQYRLPIKIINLNNAYMGMVRQWQELFYGSRYSESHFEVLPDFVKLAEAYGHVGMRVTDPAKVDDAIQEALSIKDRLVFLDVAVDPTANVFPMVPGGKGLTEMVLFDAP
jgi:acetolactate synthase-1/2/3 large subunit